MGNDDCHVLLRAVKYTRPGASAGHARSFSQVGAKIAGMVCTC